MRLQACAECVWVMLLFYLFQHIRLDVIYGPGYFVSGGLCAADPKSKAGKMCPAYSSHCIFLLLSLISCIIAALRLCDLLEVYLLIPTR